MEKSKNDKNQVYYSKAEEIFNVVSHMAGTVLAIAAAALCVIKCGINAYRGKYDHPALSIVSVCLFGAMLILLYLMSTLYHSRKQGGRARAVFRRFDHCMVALLIAGTYAPYTLMGLVEYGTKQPADMVWGIVIASVVLGAATLTVVFNAINVHKFRYFGMSAYVVMGWCIIIRVYHIALAIGRWSFVFLLVGGVLYTAGIFFYSMKRIKFNHAIWHIFVVAASVAHFVSVFFFLI